MRAYIVFVSLAVLAMFLVRTSDAVACSSTVTTDCTDCSLTANAEDADCTTTTTTTTTESTVTLKPNKKIVRISNLEFTAVRRVRVNRGGTSSSSTSSSSTRNNRRGNGSNRKVRVRVG